jgi:hypothetical protein
MRPELAASTTSIKIPFDGLFEYNNRWYHLGGMFIGQECAIHPVAGRWILVSCPRTCHVRLIAPLGAKDTAPGIHHVIAPPCFNAPDARRRTRRPHRHKETRRVA